MSATEFQERFIAGRIYGEDSRWREVDPRDQSRIKCDRVHMCGNNAKWASKNGPPFSYVCGYHRAVFEATGTFWKDGSE